MIGEQFSWSQRCGKRLIATWFFLVLGIGMTFDVAGAQYTDRESEAEKAAPPESQPPIQTESAYHVVAKSGWRFMLAPYLWASSIRAEVDEGPVSTTTEACFTELLKDLNLAAQLRFEGIHDDRWGFYLDGTYLRLGDDSKVRVGKLKLVGIDLETDFTQSWLDFGGLIRFGKQGRSFDLMLGGRYVHLATEASAGFLLDIDNSTDIVSPVAGGRVEWALSDRWIVSIQGDVGGFGIGDAADLVWGATGLVGYHLNERATLGFGYRYYDIGTSNGDVDTDVKYHGPLVGVAFHF